MKSTISPTRCGLRSTAMSDECQCARERLGSVVDMNTRHTSIRTPEIDAVVLVATDDALVGIYFPGHWTKPDEAAFGPAVDETADVVLGEASRQLRQYLAGKRQQFDLPIALVGSVFQQRVGALLREVPFGQTTTYGALAEKLGDRAM